ncbi:MAG: hypothetical protein ACHQII_00245 [Bacteroidia bacterium]
MPTTETAFSQQKIDNLKQYLESNKEQGEAEYYEIFVDTLRVVRRTNDLSRFDNYTDFLLPQTESISILIYDGASPRNNKHKFILKDKAKQAEALSGIEIDNRIMERIKTEKEKWDNELLKKDYEELSEELDEAENTIAELQEKLEICRTQKGNTTIGEVASVALEGIVRRNPQMLAVLPGGEALAGAFIQDNEAKQKLLDAPPSNEPEPKVSFKMAGEEEPKEVLSEEDKISIGFLKQLKTAFDAEQMTQVFSMLDIFKTHPDSIDKTLQYVSDLYKE